MGAPRVVVYELFVLHLAEGQLEFVLLDLFLQKGDLQLELSLYTFPLGQ